MGGPVLFSVVSYSAHIGPLGALHDAFEETGNPIDSMSRPAPVPEDRG